MKTTFFALLHLFLSIAALITCTPVASRAQAPPFTWVHASGGPADDNITAIVADNTGNFYVTGKFSSSVNFGGQTLTSAGLGDAYVAKYSPSGFMTWVKRIGLKAEDYGVALALDGTGNLFVTGVITDTITTSAKTFLARYDTNGNQSWQILSSARGNAQPQAIAIDPVTLDVLVSGSAYDSVRFGGLATADPLVIPPSQQDVFLMRFDQSGKAKWFIRGYARSGGSAFLNSAPGLACDQSGNTYWGGCFFDTINILGQRYPGSKVNTTPLILSIDSLGKARYSRIPNALGTKVTALAATPTGTILACGSSTFLQRMNIDGVFDKTIINSGTGIAANSISVLPTGEVFLAGTLTTPLSLDSVKLSPTIYSTIWMMKLDTGLHALWGQKATGTSSITFGNALVAASKTGDRYFAGSFRDTALFGATIAGTKGGQDGFFAHQFERSITTLSASSGPFCPGDSISVSYGVGGGFLNGNIFNVELSDTNGDFNSPTRIASVTATLSGIIKTRIPVLTRAGTHYRVRVSATLPVLVGNPAPGFFTVFAKPSATITPNQNINICENDTVLIAVTGGSNWLWSTKDTSSSIVVHKTGTYSVTVGGPSGCPVTLGPVNVTVHLLPPTPAITRLGSTLYSSSSTNNQWYFNHKAIPGATNSSYDVTIAGEYAVAFVDANGCSSLSDPIIVSTGGVENSTTISFDAKIVADEIFAAPALKLALPKEAFVTIELYDLLGNRLGASFGVNLHEGTTKYQIGSLVPNLLPGSYFVRIAGFGIVKSLKLIIGQ